MAGKPSRIFQGGGPPSSSPQMKSEKQTHKQQNKCFDLIDPLETGQKHTGVAVSILFCCLVVVETILNPFELLSHRRLGLPSFGMLLALAPWPAETKRARPTAALLQNLLALSTTPNKELSIRGWFLAKSGWLGIKENNDGVSCLPHKPET